MQSKKHVHDGQKNKKAETRRFRSNTQCDNHIDELEHVAVHALPIGIGGEVEGAVGGLAAATEKL